MGISVDQLSKLTRDNSLPLDVFREILRNKYGSGWSIVRNLGKDPVAIEQALNSLRAMGLVETEESGVDNPIDGIYYPTSQGLSLWEDLNVTS